MITATRIKDVMTKNVINLSTEDSFWDIQRIFRTYQLRHAPVCQDGNLVGMISLIDLRHFFPARDEVDTPGLEGSSLTASQIMVSDPVTLQSDQTMNEAARIFSENEFHAIPVLEGSSLVGIISTTDVIRFLIDSVDELEQNIVS